MELDVSTLADQVAAAAATLMPLIMVEERDHLRIVPRIRLVIISPVLGRVRSSRNSSSPGCLNFRS